MTAPRPKVAVLVNMLAPSRIPVYAGLAAHFDLLVLHGGTESNRDSWHGLESALPNAQVTQAWGWQIPIARNVKGQVFDKQYMHITPGYIWHLLRFRPHAVISNEMGLRTLIALAYGTIFHRPIWVWWGGTTHTERKIGLLKKSLRKLVSRWATRWISYGQSSTEYLLTLGIPRERMLQIQNAVDEQRFTQGAEPELQLRPRPVLLYVGQFIARKGVELLLNAAAAVQAQGHEFSLLLVGSGPDRPILERRIKDLGLRNVSFQPSLPPNKMPPIYRGADALIFPTLEDPWGLVVNEAMLSGLPVLCSEYAGCAEELLTSGSIFDPQNTEEFASKLRQVVSGQLPKPDLSRLKTMSQIVDQLIRDLDTRLSAAPRRLPVTSTELPIQR